MSIKANISYTTDAERDNILKLIEPIKHLCSIKMTSKNKYKHIYITLK